MLKDYLSSFAPQLHGHVELRAQISTSHAVAMLNGDLQSNARAQQGGVSARVYRNGVYGFASAVEYEEESWRRVLKAAEENALFLDARVKKNRPALPVLPSGMVAKDKEYIEVPQKDYIEFVRAADDYLKQKYPNLLSRRVLLRHDCMEKLLTVSDGTNSHSVRPRTHLVVQLTADEEARGRLYQRRAEGCCAGSGAGRYSGARGCGPHRRGRPGAGRLRGCAQPGQAGRY